uniref:Uncharacterized protein n=1 Tax=Ditylenchus dipsaci TaxID=166011 RepID=A0A915DQK6_9BILA
MVDFDYALTGRDENVQNGAGSAGSDGKKVVVDPLKAVHSVQGVSAREYIDMFFNLIFKSEWDDTLVKSRS